MGDIDRSLEAHWDLCQTLNNQKPELDVQLHTNTSTKLQEPYFEKIAVRWFELEHQAWYHIQHTQAEDAKRAYDQLLIYNRYLRNPAFKITLETIEHRIHVAKQYK